MDKYKVLIVEDERIVAFDLKEKISRLNYEVIDMAFTGEEAVLKTLKKIPNLVLMDINLGEGMDGIEAASKIHQHADIPVIYVTANADLSTVEKARDTEPYGYINKPINIRDLYTCIDSALNRHKMKLKLHESEKKFRNIVQSSPLGIHIYELNETGNLVFIGANESADIILGVDNTRYIGKTIEEAFPPLAETEVPKKYKITASTGSPWRSEHIAYKDELISGVFELYAFQTEHNKMAAMFIDVTEKRRAEDEIKEKSEKLAALNLDLKTAIEELETTNEELVRAQVELIQREDFLQSILRVVPAGIGTIINGVIVWMNKMLAEMTGYSEEELAGLSMRMLYGDNTTYENVEKNLGEQILKEGRGSVETEWLRKDGRKIFVLFAATTVSEIKKNEEITFTALDITERKHSYNRLIQSEKMMTVGGLAAGMAHEINNPLGIIMQGVQMIQNRIDFENSMNIKIADKLKLDMRKLYEYMKSRKVLEYIGNIRDAVVRAANIVSNMLQFSRKSEIKSNNVDLNELIEKSIEIASKDYDLEKKYDFRSINIIRKYDKSLKKISCIETEIGQVILNLLKNSAQSISEQNRQNIRPGIEIVTRMENSFVVIEVIDNGPGMEQEILNRVFEPFYTTKKVGTGTGLGLSVSYFIITNNHSGSITADSAPGKGAKFTIKLPVSSA